MHDRSLGPVSGLPGRPHSGISHQLGLKIEFVLIPREFAAQVQCIGGGLSTATASPIGAVVDLVARVEAELAREPTAYLLAPPHLAVVNCHPHLHRLGTAFAESRHHLLVLVQRPLVFELLDEQARTWAGLDHLHRRCRTFLQSRCDLLLEVLHALRVSQFRTPRDRAYPGHALSPKDKLKNARECSGRMTVLPARSSKTPPAPASPAHAWRSRWLRRLA